MTVGLGTKKVESERNDKRKLAFFMALSRRILSSCNKDKQKLPNEPNSVLFFCLFGGYVGHSVHHFSREGEICRNKEAFA